MTRRAMAVFAAAMVACAVVLAGCSGDGGSAPGAVASQGGADFGGQAGVGTSPSAPSPSVPVVDGDSGASWLLIQPAGAGDGAGDSAGDGDFGAELAGALAALADQNGAALEVVPAADGTALAAAVGEAVASGPDVIIGATPAATEEFSYTAAENLGQQFLLIDGQPAEPTENLMTLLFDVAGCPTGATCVTQGDIYDPQILAESDAFDLAEAIDMALAQARETPGTILLATVEFHSNAG